MGVRRQRLVGVIAVEPKRWRIRHHDQQFDRADFDFVADHRGMFSLLGLPVEAVDHLKAENGVYMTSDSRINVAGIPEDRVGDLADAVLAAIR